MTAEQKLDLACDEYARDTVATCETDERVGVGFDLAREAIALLRRYHTNDHWEGRHLGHDDALWNEAHEFLDGKPEEGA
jgi:hypothetical protein